MNKFMNEALVQARIALSEGEVPVGAVIVRDGEIISYGRNRRENQKNALCHAEIEAINNACEKLGYWRLDGCEMYVTLEPCPMCAGAIINARINKVYFGAYDSKGGACGSITNVCAMPFCHKPEVFNAVDEEQCTRILKEFFKSLRER